MLKLDTVDSTNNYAMRLIDAHTAAHGLTILAERQTAGKGQRGRTWSDMAGHSLLMSIILKPPFELQAQPLFLAAIAVAVAEELQSLKPDGDVRIKWPNDIIVGDKKAGGILIENTVRGQAWQWSVVGIGLNVGQQAMPEALPNATSLRLAIGHDIDIESLAGSLRQAVLRKLSADQKAIMPAYNDLLYRAGGRQQFAEGERRWEATICGVNDQGQLMVRLADGSMAAYTHGSVEWVWGER